MMFVSLTSSRTKRRNNAPLILSLQPTASGGRSASSSTNNSWTPIPISTTYNSHLPRLEILPIEAAAVKNKPNTRPNAPQ